MVEEQGSEKESAAKTPSSGKLSSEIWLHFGTLLIAVVLLAVFVTYSLTVSRYAAKESEAAFRFRVLEQYLDDVAYYDYDYDNMLDEAIRAYVASSGDPYTVYYDAEEFEQLKQADTGNYVGIGVSVETGETVYKNKTIKVLRLALVRKNSPAQKAGLIFGDEIVAITTESGTTRINDVSYSAASALIRGEAGSSVTLSILREVSNEKVLLDFTVPREDLVLESVDGRVSEIDGTVGIITITGFDLTTPEGLKKNMDSLLELGVRRFVIDLRNNGGGDLQSVIACAGMFLQKNETILSTKDKNGKEQVYVAKERIHTDKHAPCSLRAEEIGKYRGNSYVLLINGNTASAAELLTAVFRDYSLGTIVGERSYGKGSIQGVHSLASVGLEGGVRVTTKMYFPPCGEGYNGIGIEPDITVEFPADKTLGMIREKDDPQLMQAIQLLKNK